MRYVIPGELHKATYPLGFCQRFIRTGGGRRVVLVDLLFWSYAGCYIGAPSVLLLELNDF